MKYMAAYMLLCLGGKENPTGDDVKALLEKAGVEVEAEKLEALSKAVEGKNIDEMIAEGKEKMKAVAGAAGSGGGSAGAAGGAGDAGEEKKEEAEEAEDVDVGGGGLFGGDEGGDGY